jgi:hypothetical protein
MATFKVVLEIEVEAKNPLKAAKTVQEWFDDADTKWQFYVQKSGQKKMVSVDLNEDDSAAVLPVGAYEPMIQSLIQK